MPSHGVFTKRTLKPPLAATASKTSTSKPTILPLGSTDSNGANAALLATRYVFHVTAALAAEAGADADVVGADLEQAANTRVAAKVRATRRFSNLAMENLFTIVTERCKDLRARNKLCILKPK